MIESIQIPNEVKGPSISAQIVGMEIGRIKAPIEKSPYIRTLISGTIKYQHPTRSYKTESNPDDPTTFFIIREK